MKYIHLGQDRKSPSLTSKKRRVKTTTTTQPDSTDMGMTIEPSVLDTRPDKANRAGSCCYWHDSSFQFQEDGACYARWGALGCTRSGGGGSKISRFSIG